MQVFAQVLDFHLNAWSQTHGCDQCMKYTQSEFSNFLLVCFSQNEISEGFKGGIFWMPQKSFQATTAVSASYLHNQIMWAHEPYFISTTEFLYPHSTENAFSDLVNHFNFR